MADNKIPRPADDYPAGNYPQRPKFIPAVTAVVIILSAAAMWWLYNFYYQTEIGPRQPVPFSHRLHAGMKNISCVMCHEGVFTSSNAGIPPLETCILCHEKILVSYPPVQRLRAMYLKGQPVEWIKINELPDYVYFNHSVHLARKIDCRHCHGNVLMMDRIEAVHEFTMGFCIECHRDYKATVDCFTCHR